mmetsp:Transcript_32023/g.80344  ORF Transcript_32023/g.80344 Transcript_32023/m.80344 type:complete len:145 (-) Transcript_32023:142-576(-)|eukprot:CAMPEP_0177628588 /NCGR_PEP_ID=MMETSP0447-20121125/211_1 /TAXON_ID=0 /ORGANISM="Stygamoeba regulata, Strain BSH-02190019" /LENGTH=144 /DNA_ID=CAMNT_0019129845 /DNA_START=20 /DNA_END=454 /DNA_ORIENTATION=+
MAQISPDQLTVEQLNAVKQSIEEDIESLTNSIAQLRMAASRYGESKESLKAFEEKNKGEKILVPLTGSLYVPGTLSDVDHVLVDIGTGYLVQKSIKGADDYVARKMSMISGNVDTLQKELVESRKKLEAICMMLQQKVVGSAGK